MKRVAVLRGGSGDEYQVSMQAGQAVLRSLNELGYVTKDIVVTKKGDWLESGFVRPPEKTLEAIDTVFIALRGQSGEGGQVQRLLEQRRLPFIGTRSLSSAIAFNKDLTKQTMSNHNVKLPRHRKLTVEEYTEIDLDQEIPLMLAEFGPEILLKPVFSGSSSGVRFVQNQQMLRSALEELFFSFNQIMIEEYIRGREASVGVLGNFRNQERYVLPVIEVVPPAGQPFFSYENKHSSQINEVVPGRFSYYEKSILSEIASLAHEVIGCRQYSRSDFIVRDGEVYFLEINTAPTLTAESLYSKASSAVGLSYDQLIRHLVETC